MMNFSSLTSSDMDVIMQLLKQQHLGYAPVSQHQQQQQQQPPPLPLERKAVGSPTASRQRASSCMSPVDYMSSSPVASPSKFSPPPPGLGAPSLEQSAAAQFLASHNQRTLERSFSEPMSPQQQPQEQEQDQEDQEQQQQPDNRPSKSSNINPSRYKTEMCRPFEESGHCKYGDKCQFAHGAHELRNLARHPKYKTDLCRTFHTVGFCPYGPRCHFIHNEDEHKLNYIIHQKQQQAVQQAVVQQVAQVQLQQHILQHSMPPAPIQRPSKLYMPNYSSNHRDIMGSTADSPPDSVTSNSPQSLSPTSGMSDHSDVFSPYSNLGSAALTPPPCFPGNGGGMPLEFSAALANMAITTPTPISMPLNVDTVAAEDNLVSLGIRAMQPAAQDSAPSSMSEASSSSSLDGSFHSPPSPPESINGEEVESHLQRSLRLPFFSQLNH